MKSVTIPTLTAGLTAAMSVLFFAGLSRVFGDDTLGQIILVQSAAALVVIACVPQCWVYLLEAQGHDELVTRYRTGFTVELVGFALGALIIAITINVSGSERWQGGLVIFASLAVQASSSCLGWLRATESWRRYFLWVIGPNLLRVPLIWTTPWLISEHWLNELRSNSAIVMALYFLLPDMLRWTVIAVPIAMRQYRWPGLVETVAAIRIILRNFLFDIGSGVTDVADKVLIGILLGPQTLVAYFFGRRLGIISTMVCEPLYAEKFRRISAVSEPVKRSLHQTTTYRNGLALAFILFLVMLSMVAVATQFPQLNKLIPAAVLTMFPLFVLVLLVECMLAANRWSRYVVQLNGGALQLIMVRVAIFTLFALNVWLFGDMFAGLGLAAAFALTWLLEAGYLVILLRRT